MKRQKSAQLPRVDPQRQAGHVFRWNTHHGAGCWERSFITMLVHVQLTHTTHTQIKTDFSQIGVGDGGLGGGYFQSGGGG